MRKIHLILVLLFAFAVLTCTSGVASAISISPKYVGNTMVDLSWTQYWSTDFSKYELCRDGFPIKTITDRTVTFYRDAWLTKGNTYEYWLRVYNATGGLVETRTTSATTGEVHGVITLDTKWTAPSSPYTLTEGVNVRNGANLTIENGVMVTNTSSCIPDIDVMEKGALYADGVSFSGVSINIDDDSHADIKKCFFEKAIIFLYSSNNNVITGNTLSNSYYIALSLFNSSNNVIAGNTFLNANAAISLDISNKNDIIDNNASSNDLGVFLVNSSNNVITGNTLSNNRWDGIFLRNSSNNVIKSNTVSNNNDIGIYLENSSNNVIKSNTVSNNNDIGIYLENSSNNEIYNNYFNNTENAYDDGNNIWNVMKTPSTNIVGGPYLGGNYWSDYNGTDLDGDRLGNTLLPYNCSGGIENGGDFHPLITIRSNIVTIANNQVGEHYLWGAEGQIPGDDGEVIMATPYVEQIVGREIAHHTAQETTEGSHYCSGRHAHSEVTRLPHGDPDNQTHQANYPAYSWERYDWRCTEWVYGEACEGHRHFDCSGLVYFVYNQTGVPLVRTNVGGWTDKKGIYHDGYMDIDTDIARTDLKPGDVCYQTYRRTKHIGIYVGGNQITHAVGHDKGVITTLLDASWNGFGRLLPPIVESAVPAKDAKIIPLNTNIVVNFDGKMDKASVESALSISPSVSGTFTWSNNDKTLTFNPSSDLKKKTTYTVTIGTGAKDLGGKGIDGDADGREGPAYSWSFETVECTKNLDCGKDTKSITK